MLTHSSNQNVWSSNSAACTTSGPGTIHNNSFIRVFDTDDFNIQDTAFFVYIQLGVESTSGGAYDLIGRVHKLDGSLVFANMNLIAADTAAVYPDSTIYKMNIPMKDGYTLPGDTLVTEVFAPLNGAIIFFPGSNPYVESSPSYIAAAGCGIPEPTEYSAIGFASAHLVLNLWVNHKPTLNNMALSVFKDNVLSFQKADFDAAMSDYDTDTIGMVRIETLPPNGTLELSGTPLAAGDTVYSNELASLTYTPNAGFSGNDSYDVRVRDAYHWSNNTTQVDITVFNWQVGLTELTESTFLIYPNPAGDLITLNADQKIQSVRIFDNQGAEQKVHLGQNGQVDVSALAGGIYFVMVKTEAGFSVEKLVKQ
ncbi:MAG: T9SS type A sorting domain-containing protein [Bacteroidetes bacterium]|nr:T9SS type A sorting domain-containing protein [Bacteroidota bacterium]